MGKGGGSVFVFFLLFAARHSTAHPRVRMEPLKATEPHTAVANVEKQPNHTGKAKEGFVFLNKDLHAAKNVIKND